MVRQCSPQAEPILGKLKDKRIEHGRGYHGFSRILFEAKQIRNISKGFIIII